MTIVEILSVILPPCFAFAFHVHSQRRMHEYELKNSYDKAFATVDREKARALNDEQAAALRIAIEDVDAHKDRIAQLEQQSVDHQSTINKLCERTF